MFSVVLSCFQYRPDQYFRDGIRKIDFVLVRSSDLPPSHHAHDARQEIFEANLVSAGAAAGDRQHAPGGLSSPTPDYQSAADRRL